MATKQEEEAAKKNRTPNLGAAAPPAPPAAPAPAKQPAAPAQPKPQPLAAPTPEQVQANLPGLSVGQQTRGAGGVRLDQQQAPAGKELIGMRSGVPIYADATDVYSSQASSIMSKSDAADKAARASVNPTLAQELGALSANPYKAEPKTAVSTPVTLFANAGVTPTTEELRGQYQKDAAAARQEIEQKYKQPEQPKYFSKEYADQFTAAQEAANQRAKERIAYGGQPVRDTSNSMAIANNAASALRNVASAPKTAGMEELRSYGFDKDTEKRLSFGVGPKGESINVTSDYLKDYAASQGITKRPGPTFQNPFLGANRPSNRIFRRPGL